MGGSRKPVPPPATLRWESLVFLLPALRPVSRQCEQPGAVAGESSAAPSFSTAPVQRWAAEPSSVTDGRPSGREERSVAGGERGEEEQPSPAALKEKATKRWNQPATSAAVTAAGDVR